MKTWRGFGAGMLLLAVLTGCSGTTEPVVDDDEVQEWLDAWDDVDIGDDAFGMAAGTASSPSDSDDATTLSNLDGGTVTEIEFSCFGDQAMSLDFEVRGAAMTQGGTAENLACDDSPHMIEVNVEDVIEIRLNGVSSKGLGAWAAIPRGTD